MRIRLAGRIKHGLKDEARRRKVRAADIKADNVCPVSAHGGNAFG
jgi:hypothetical protein